MTIERFDINNPLPFAKEDILSPSQTAWFLELGVNRNVAQHGDVIIYDSEGFTLVTKSEYESDGLEIDKRFGSALVDEYLRENRALSLTVEQSLSQAQKFQGVKLLLESGALIPGRALLSTVIPDEVFTEQRKNYYLTKLTNFIQ